MGDQRWRETQRAWAGWAAGYELPSGLKLTIMAVIWNINREGDETLVVTSLTLEIGSGKTVIPSHMEVL